MKVHFNKIALMAGIVLLSACSTIEEAPQYNEPKVVEKYVRLAPSAPPHQIKERMPEPTLPTMQIWRPGFWDYDGTKFNWMRGHYMLRPSPTASWIADRWEKHTYGWAFIPGHWK